MMGGERHDILRLREVREERRISLRQVAAEVGLSPDLISQFERGLTTPSLDTLRKLARALDEPLFNLLDEPEKTRVALVRPERHLSLAPPGGDVAYARITPGFGRFKVLEGVLQPGDSSAYAPWRTRRRSLPLFSKASLRQSSRNTPTPATASTSIPNCRTSSATKPPTGRPTSSR